MGDLNFTNPSDIALEVLSLRKLRPSYYRGESYQDFPIRIKWNETTTVDQIKPGGAFQIFEGWPFNKPSVTPQYNPNALGAA
jgi:hypothetical protein